MENKKLSQDIQSIRRDHVETPLEEKNAPTDPFELFEQWMTVVMDKESIEPNAMTLATSSKDGTPSARIVLLKDYSSEGFMFFTNYNSRKGQNLEENPKASLVFYWMSLSRQVLVDGDVVKTDRATSEDYFHSRPHSSQIAGLVSDQSHSVESREELEKKVLEAESQYQNQEVPCPDNWGGYILKPHRIEFWQGRQSRLHDRLSYTKQDDGSWKCERLAP